MPDAEHSMPYLSLLRPNLCPVGVTMTHRTHHRLTAVRAIALAGCVALTGTLVACSSDSSTDGPDGDVVIRVQGMPAATDEAGLAAFEAKVEAFEEANPGITVEGSTNVWDPLTFSAQLAGGSIEDVIRVPLTEPRGLIERGQVQPITSQLSEWDHSEEFNPQVLEPLSDADGEIYGIPQSPFALGLVYNRALFDAAGLDPDKPPTTWDEVRTYAKQISDATGAAGFVHESKDNSGGWQLTMMAYSHGGEVERRDGDTFVADFQNDAVRDSLTLLQQMRWSDNSMGESQLLDQNDATQQFAAGQIGMFMGTPGIYRLAKMNFDMADTASFGMAAMPQSGGNATLSGSEVYMIPASVSEEQAAAAVEWLVFAYAEPQYDADAAAEQAKTLAADPAAAVGVPVLPMFDEEQQAKIDEAVAPYVNVELEHFQPYIETTPTLELRPEPPFQAQTLYEALDPVVQAVLTDPDADIDALLASAEQDANAKLASAG